MNKLAIEFIFNTDYREKLNCLYNFETLEYLKNKIIKQDFYYFYKHIQAKKKKKRTTGNHTKNYHFDNDKFEIFSNEAAVAPINSHILFCCSKS